LGENSLTMAGDNLNRIPNMFPGHGACMVPSVVDLFQQRMDIVMPLNFANTMLLYNRVFQALTPLQRLREADLNSDLSLDEIFRRGAQTARAVMSPPMTIAARESEGTAVSCISDNNVQFQPLLEEQNRIVGVASPNDVQTALQTLQSGPSQASWTKVRSRKKPVTRCGAILQHNGHCRRYFKPSATPWSPQSCA